MAGKLERALGSMGLSAIYYKFRDEKLEPSQVLNLFDKELTRLGVVTLGDRLRLKALLQEPADQRRIKLQDSQLNEIPQYLVRPCVKSPTVARAARDFRYQDNTGTLSPVSLERANNHDRNS